MSGIKDVKKRSMENLQKLLSVYTTGKVTPHSERSRKQIERELDRREKEVLPSVQKKKAVKKKVVKKKAAARTTKKAQTKKKTTTNNDKAIQKAIRSEKPGTLKGLIKVVVSVDPEIALRDMSRIVHANGFTSPLGSVRSCLWSVKHENDPPKLKGKKKAQTKKKLATGRKRGRPPKARETSIDAERRIKEADAKAQLAERGELSDDLPLHKRRKKSKRLVEQMELRNKDVLNHLMQEKYASNEKRTLLEKMIEARSEWPVLTRNAMIDLCNALDKQYKGLTCYTRIISTGEG